MLTGIDDVDWASMGHAYTESATDVPDLLRGLASDDPAERDIALDGMYGAVHHQGDVYDSTVACIPFLFELAALRSLADRAAIVYLLCSIGGGSDPDPAELDAPFADEEENAAYARRYLDAWAEVRERADVFLALLDDPDADVRAAATWALARMHRDPARVLGALCERLPVETEPGTLRALAEAVGKLGARHPQSLAAEAGRTLRALVMSAGSDPELRLAALTQLAGCAPRSLPEDTAELALSVMRLAHEQKASGPRPPEPGPERPRTDTMVSYLRELEATRRASVDADVADDLLTELHHALGDRTDLRHPLLLGQLGSPDPGRRMVAVRMAGALMTGWRMPDDEPLIALARQLEEPDLHLNKAALNELLRLAPIAHPVADDVMAYMGALVKEGRDVEPGLTWADTALGKAAEVLTLLGDQRIVPGLKSVLEHLTPPENIERWLRAMGPEAGLELGPLLHGRLAALDPGDGGTEMSRLLDGLGVLTRPESLPLVLTVLRTAHDDQSSQWHALRALTRYGPAAAEAAPLLRKSIAAGTTSDQDRLEAAGALWAVAGNAEAGLPVLRAGLEAERWYDRSVALRVIGQLGPAAAPLAADLRGGKRGVEETVALWKVTGDADETLPVLLHHWTARPGRRAELAACLAEMGTAAAPALPVVREELASTRRHGTDNSNRSAGESVNVRGDVASDEELLEDCRRIVAALETDFKPGAP